MAQPTCEQRIDLPARKNRRIAELEACVGGPETHIGRLEAHIRELEALLDEAIRGPRR